MRLSAFTGCGIQSGSITSSLSWRTKCYMDVHQVTLGHLSASPMCLYVEHSAPPAQTASWCRQLIHHRRQSSLLGRCSTSVSSSTPRSGCKTGKAGGRAPKAQVSSAVGARIEASKAPRRVRCGEGVPLPTGAKDWEGGCASHKSRPTSIFRTMS